MANGKTNKRIVFWGTSGICVPFLEALYHHFEIPLIITQPDSMGGRGRQTIIPPVKKFAIEKGIEFIQPENFKDNSIINIIKDIAPVIGVVISYGKLIPSKLYLIPEYHTVNAHFSLLPYYRGAAPVQRAIEKGEKKTGITIFEINKKMDSGDIWAKKEFDILEEDTTLSMWKRLPHEGGPFLVETIEDILAGNITPIPQNHELATYAPAVEKTESLVNWQLHAVQIYNKARAFTPWPGLSCSVEGKVFKLTAVRVMKNPGNTLPESIMDDKEPGDIIVLDKESLKICCADKSVIEILEIQPPGKKPMTPYNFCLGNRLPKRLG